MRLTRSQFRKHILKLEFFNFTNFKPRENFHIAYDVSDNLMKEVCKKASGYFQNVNWLIYFLLKTKKKNLIS